MKILLVGARGRLGSEIRKVATEQNIVVENVSRDHVGDVTALANLMTEPLLIIDSSLPQGTENLCNSLREIPQARRSHIRGVVIGVTGHSASQLANIEKTAGEFPICLVSNFSRGIFLFEQILGAKTEGGKTVAELIRSLGFDIAMTEVHHTKKMDAPSGTAKTLASAAHIPYERVSSLRVGHVIGQHEIVISGDSEELRLSHTAHSRRLFALGAVELGRQMFARKPLAGLLSVADFMG